MTAATLPTPPGPASRFPGDHLLRLRRDRLATFRAMAAAHGDVSELRIGRQRIVLITHPDDIRDVLVTHQRNFTKGQALQRAKQLIGEGLLTSEGDLHRRQRRLVQPAFHRTQIAAWATAMTAAADATQQRWRDGAHIDAHAAMMHTTLSIVASTLFGADVSGETSDIAAALQTAFDSFDMGYGPLTALLDRLPTKRRRQFRASKARVDATIARMIAERRASPTDRTDLLSMLLAAVDQDGDGTGMSDTQLRDEALTLFLAGHETTSNALTWTWLLLARHPEAERALHAELATVLGGRTPVMEDVSGLPMTRAVLAEAMRLHPPAYMIGRRSMVDYMVQGYEFPAGTLFLSPQYIVHRDPRWWPDADAFRPERWLDGSTAMSRPKFAYFPFGGGTRICVGEQFAWMEAILVLATLAQRWRLHVDGPDPAPDAIITMRPAGGLPARLEQRL